MNHTFTLYAPTAKAVGCRCSAWGMGDKPMERQEDGTWVLEAEVPEGRHTYVYHLNSLSWFAKGKEVDIADPLSRRLTEDHQATILEIPARLLAESYRWKHDAVPHPGHDLLAIYELYVQDYPSAEGKGTFDGVTAQLAHIAGLGFTAVELMPVMLAGGWGYTPTFFHAVEPRFGDEHGLCHLVDEAHAAGMAVFFDGVYNHAGTECPLAHIDHDCYFHHAPTNPDQAWGPQFNYSLNIPGTAEYPARHFIKAKVAHWIKVFHFDGIRYDAVSQIADHAFLGELVTWTKGLAGVKPFFSIAECLPLDHSLVGQGRAMDACWNEPFGQRMRALLAGRWDGDALSRCCDCRKDGFQSGKNAVNYLGSHDTGHTVRHLLDQGLDEAAALYRMRLGLTVLITGVGVPMVWMGDEFGALDPANAEPHPLPWGLLDDPRRRELCDVVRGLLTLRREHAALRGDNCSEIHRDDEQHLLVIHRWDEAGGRVLVAIHAGDGDRALVIDPPATGTWHEHVLDFDHTTDAEGRLLIELAGWQAQVFIYRPG